MGRKRKEPDAPLAEVQTPETPKTVYPSREKIRYVGLPHDLYAMIKRLARQKSSQYDKKSATWAARLVVIEGLKALKLWPLPADILDELLKDDDEK